MSLDLQSAACGFLIGAAIGASGSYYGTLFTERRKEKSEARNAKAKFVRMKNRMMPFITELKADLGAEGMEVVREFFVLPSRTVKLGGSSQVRFLYYEDEHVNLRACITILENEGFVEDISPGNAPLFRMSEEFVESVMRYT